MGRKTRVMIFDNLWGMIIPNSYGVFDTGLQQVLLLVLLHYSSSFFKSLFCRGWGGRGGGGGGGASISPWSFIFIQRYKYEINCSHQSLHPYDHFFSKLHNLIDFKSENFNEKQLHDQSIGKQLKIFLLQPDLNTTRQKIK